MLLHCLDNVDGIKKIAKQYVQIDIKVISYIHIWHSYIDPNFALKWCIFLENKKKKDSDKPKVHVDLMSLHLKKREWTPVPQCLMLFCKKGMYSIWFSSGWISKPAVDFQDIMRTDIMVIKDEPQYEKNLSLTQREELLQRGIICKG